MRPVDLLDDVRLLFTDLEFLHQPVRHLLCGDAAESDHGVQVILILKEARILFFALDDRTIFSQSRLGPSLRRSVFNASMNFFCIRG